MAEPGHDDEGSPAVSEGPRYGLAHGLVGGPGLAFKVAAAGAMVGVLSLLLLAPFGASNDRAAASCPGVWTGNGDAPGSNSNLRSEQIAFARIIDQVAVARGLPGQATLVALMTALQESQLQNIGYGDRDSVGLFQQRPSAGWGSVAQILNPRYAADAFFGGSNSPSPPGLVDIDNWPSMTYTEAAQAVQVSAFPDAYARHEQTARAIAAQAGIDLSRTGDPYAGRAGVKPASGVGQVAKTNDCGGGQGLYAGKPISGVWPAQRASVTDPTGTGGLVTPRTALWVQMARQALGSPSMSCWDPHLWNPRSDHPAGRACDVMVGADARRSAPARKAGDRIATWTTRTAGQTGVKYVIWYGQIWSARTGQWKVYDGGGIYDTSDATGGHYDHVHVSLY
jgi:hypothetical protein